MATHRIEWLIDNGQAYEALLNAIRDARETIRISQLAFDADCKAYSADKTEMDAEGESILDTILAASGQRGVRVQMLLNSSLLLNTRRPLLRALADRKVDPHRVEVRGISRFPQLLHAKLVIIDERCAFLMGSPLANGYWDTPTHAPVDHRRPRRELGGRPVHDLSMGVGGPAVQDLAQIFARLWAGAEHRDSTMMVREQPGVARRQRAIGSTILRNGPQRAVEVVTTEPRGGRGSTCSGSLKTLDALLDGIGRARSLIYIEHQYLSSRPVVEALRRALDRERKLEMILVLNQNPDVTAYRRWQAARLTESGILGHPRVGAFTLWSTQSRDGGARTVSQVFVHSKVVVVDDEWAMVGSANLDGVSLDSYGDDFSGRLARWVFRDVRNFDVGLVLRVAKERRRATNSIRELRRRLWTEHLGRELPDSRLAAWKAVASENISALNSTNREDGASAPAGSFILPYSTRARPRAQLLDVGIQPSADIHVAFDPGWLEVNFSPNWVRNMFL